MDRDTITIIFGTLFVIAFIVVIYIKVKERRKIRATGIKVEGIIYEVIRRYSSDSDGDGGYFYYPVVRYMVSEDELITKEYYVGRNPSPYKEGDKVLVIYDKDDHSKFILEGKVKK